MVELSDWQEEKLGNLDAPVSAVLQVLTEIRDLLERNEPTYTAGTAVKTAVETAVRGPSIIIREAYRGPEDALRLLEQLMKQASVNPGCKVEVELMDLSIIKQALTEESIRE